MNFEEGEDYLSSPSKPIAGFIGYRQVRQPRMIRPLQ